MADKPKPAEVKPKVCPVCFGSGELREHHPGCDAHFCVKECPVRTQCETCGGTGFVEIPHDPPRH